MYAIKSNDNLNLYATFKIILRINLFVTVEDKLKKTKTGISHTELNDKLSKLCSGDMCLKSNVFSSRVASPIGLILIRLFILLSGKISFKIRKKLMKQLHEVH